MGYEKTMSRPAAHFHERFDREEKHELSSNRHFCFVFAAVFGLLSGWLFYAGHGHPLLWGGLAGVFLVVGSIRPSLAAPLNRGWAALGLLLARITNPLFLALIYFVAIMPIGLFMRLLGKTPLRLRFDASAASYWIPRGAPLSESQTMKDQF